MQTEVKKLMESLTELKEQLEGIKQDLKDIHLNIYKIENYINEKEKYNLMHDEKVSKRIKEWIYTHPDSEMINAHDYNIYKKLVIEKADILKISKDYKLSKLDIRSILMKTTEVINEILKKHESEEGFQRLKTSFLPPFDFNKIVIPTDNKGRSASIENLYKKTSDFYFSARAVNSIVAMDCVYIGDIVLYGHEIKRLPYVGKKTIVEIEKVLTSLGLKFLHDINY